MRRSPLHAVAARSSTRLVGSSQLPARASRDCMGRRCASQQPRSGLIEELVRLNTVDLVPPRGSIAVLAATWVRPAIGIELRGAIARLASETGSQDRTASRCQTPGNRRRHAGIGPGSPRVTDGSRPMPLAGESQSARASAGPTIRSAIAEGPRGRIMAGARRHRSLHGQVVQDVALELHLPRRFALQGGEGLTQRNVPRPQRADWARQTRSAGRSHPGPPPGWGVHMLLRTPMGTQTGAPPARWGLPRTRATTRTCDPQRRTGSTCWPTDQQRVRGSASGTSPPSLTGLSCHYMHSSAQACVAQLGRATWLEPSPLTTPNVVSSTTDPGKGQVSRVAARSRKGSHMHVAARRGKHRSGATWCDPETRSMGARICALTLGCGTRGPRRMGPEGGAAWQAGTQTRRLGAVGRPQAGSDGVWQGGVGGEGGRGQAGRTRGWEVAQSTTGLNGVKMKHNFHVDGH